MSKVEAIVFDVDGTLVDTSDYIYNAFEHSLDYHNLPSRSRQEIASQGGKKLEECYAFLAPNGDLAALIAAHRVFQSGNTHLIKPFEYASFLLESLQTRGKRLALLSSRKDIVPSLEITGINTGLFDVIVDGTMVEKSKPDPEGLYHILGALGLHSTTVIMVGDAAVDIETGKRADVRATIGISHGFGTREELQKAEADYIIDSLGDLIEVIAKIEQ